MFGFSAMKTVAHRLEDLATIIHSMPDSVDREVMDMLFRGRDILQAMFGKVSSGAQESGQENQLSSVEESFLSCLDDLTERLAAPSSDIESCMKALVSKAAEILPFLDGVVDSSGLEKAISAASSCLSKQENEAGSSEDGKNFFLAGQDVSSLLTSISEKLEKAQAEAVVKGDADQLYDDIESFRAMVQETGDPTPSASSESEAEMTVEINENMGLYDDIDSLLAIIRESDDQSLSAVASEAEGLVDIYKNMDFGLDQEQISCYKKLVEAVKRSSRADAAAKPFAAPSGPAKIRSAAAMESKTVRVNEKKIDAFLDSVGEMIILNEVFNHLQSRIEKALKDDLALVKELKFAHNSFSTQLFSLQKSLMNLRRVELGNITGNLARLVRDAVGQAGKEAEFTAYGGDAVVDKSLLRNVDACLVHLVRNAIDHGVETASERLRLGKSLPAKVTVETVNEENFLLVKVNDDGRGIDCEKLKKQATARGVISPERANEMSDEEARMLIFKNGLSTAENLSEQSGRGVGMSAVVENIQKMGGSINVRSKLNEGSEITLRIPLSVMLSVLDGFIVKVGSVGMVVPIASVTETFKPECDQLKTLHEKEECALLRGNVYPLVRLAEHFKIKTSGYERETAILAHTEKGHYCLMVDEIVDCRRVVVKKIDGLDTSHEILGGALLGDGTIGLVLDVDKLIESSLAAH